MTSVLASAPVAYFELVMYLALAVGAFDVLSGRSTRVGRIVMRNARAAAAVNLPAAVVGIIGFILRNMWLFRLGWVIIALGGIYFFLIGPMLDQFVASPTGERAEVQRPTASAS